MRHVGAMRGLIDSKELTSRQPRGHCLSFCIVDTLIITTVDNQRRAGDFFQSTSDIATVEKRVPRVIDL